LSVSDEDFAETCRAH